MNALVNEAKAASTNNDQTEEKKFSREVAPAGTTLARFTSYVEFGKQPQRAYQGQEKKPALEARLTFELMSPQHHNEFEVEGNTVSRNNTVSSGSITISASSKSKFFKLLNKMKAGRDSVKHFGDMLGEAFMIDITHGENKTDPTIKYVNMYNKGEWNIGACVTFNAAAGVPEAIACPDPIGSMQFLNWLDPTKLQWDSIFIDGTYEKTVDGTKTEVSKNWLQERCLAAVDYSGSALEALLSGTSDLVDAMQSSGDDTQHTNAEPEKAEDTPVDAGAGDPEEKDVIGDLFK